MERNEEPCDENYQSIRLTCCGACFCTSCDYKMFKTAVETGIEFTCPICSSFPAKKFKGKFQSGNEAGQSMPTLGFGFYWNVLSSWRRCNPVLYKSLRIPFPRCSQRLCHFSLCPRLLL